jgi:hypothetical protein
MALTTNVIATKRSNSMPKSKSGVMSSNPYFILRVTMFLRQ